MNQYNSTVPAPADLSRRGFFRLLGLGGAGALLAATAGRPAALAAPADKPADDGPFKLPPLPYAYNALEPHIDEQTMRIHHDKHHAAYVTNLNNALKDHPALQRRSIEELLRNIKDIPEAIRTAVRNNGGGHANHSMFWHIMEPSGGGEPKGKLAQEIISAFGDLGRFK